MSEKKIPTILSLILLIIAAVAGVFLIRQPKLFSSRADVTCEPVNLKTTNVTDKSFVISWSTQRNCTCSLSLTQPTSRLLKDLRSEDQVTSRNTHYYQVNNLSPETNYQFEIFSDGTTHQDHSYSVQTASVPQSSVPVANLAWGKILDEQGNPLSDIIIYLDIPGAAPLSSLTSDQGVWIVSLANSFDAVSADWFSPPGDTVEHITIDAGILGQISLTGNTDFNDPVPDIVFSTTNPPVLSLEGDKSNLGAGSFPPQTTPKESAIEFKLQNPKEGETLNTLSPEFFGTAPANTVLEITLESPQTFNVEVTPTGAGDWSWTPPDDLTPGSHTLTVKVTNSLTGLSETIVRKFYVYAADKSGPAFESSNSAGVSPTVTPTSTPSPTVTPTPALSSTPTLTIAPTATPTTAARSANPATGSGIPSPGTTLPTLVTLLFGLLLFSTGAVLVLR